jgi:hypothetical protein
LAAASQIFRQSPLTMASIAARTFLEIPAVGRRWLVEDGKRPFGRRRRDDVFHVGTIGACPAAATHQNVTFLDRGEVLAELGHSPFQRKRHLSERVNPEGRARRE